MKGTLLVVGLGWPTYGSGTTKAFGVGGSAVKYASEAGFTVRAGARNPEKYAPFYASLSNVSMVQADVTKPETLDAACAGVDAAIFAAQAPDGVSVDDVDRDGCINLARACAKHGAKLVVISSVYTSPKHSWNPLRMFMHVFIKARIMDAKWEAEEFVRKEKGIRHVIVRPGALSEGPLSGTAFEISQADSSLFGFRAISKADVARLAVAAAFDSKSDNITFEVQGGKKNAGPVTLDVFGDLKKDAVLSS